jgi:hypothetical protein
VVIACSKHFVSASDRFGREGTWNLYTQVDRERERERPGGLGGAMHEEITGDMQRDMGY